MWDNIEYIVFSGAGTRGASYIGLISSWNTHTEFEIIKKKQIKGYAGTSIGSVFSLCLLLDIENNHLTEFMTPIASNFDNIAPVFDISLMISNFGFDNGDTVKNIIRKILQKAGLSDTITLKQLKTFFPLEFVCVTTNMTYLTHEYISSQNHPDLEVVEAVYMSMCVPFLFTPVTGEEGDLYVDGVLTMNTPQCFDSSKTLCVLVDAKSNKYIRDWPTYIDRLFLCRTANQAIMFKKYNCENVIWIKNTSDDVGIDIHINQSTVKRLILSGYISGMIHIYPTIIDTIGKVLHVLVILNSQYDALPDDEYYKLSF